MLIDKGQLWNNIAVRVHWDPEEPLKAYGNLLGEIANAQVVEAIPIEWVKDYIEKKRKRFEEIRKDDEEGYFSRSMLTKIETIEEMLNAYRG